MVVHVCCKGLFLMFHLCFRTYVASVFIWVLHMFHTYIACILSGYCVCLQWFSSVFQIFLRVFQKHVSNISSNFFCMLQVLHLNVLKVDRTSPTDLYLSSVDHISGNVSHLHGGMAAGKSRPATVVSGGLRQLSDGCLWAAGLTWMRKMARETDCRRGCSNAPFV
jgi:hypothetical protein